MTRSKARRNDAAISVGVVFTRRPQQPIAAYLCSMNAWFSQRVRRYKATHRVYPVEICVVGHDCDCTALNNTWPVIKLVNMTGNNWNISRAKNIGAHSLKSDLLIFSSADVTVTNNFVHSVLDAWDTCDLWEPPTSLVGTFVGDVIAVKRWVHTRIRGFSEEMMDNPPGWGFDTNDYLLRAKAMLRSCGGSYTRYSPSVLNNVPYDASYMQALYGSGSLEESYEAHAAYSEWYRKNYGCEGNRGRPFGKV